MYTPINALYIISVYSAEYSIQDKGSYRLLLEQRFLKDTTEAEKTYKHICQITSKNNPDRKVTLDFIDLSETDVISNKHNNYTVNPLAQYMQV